MRHTEFSSKLTPKRGLKERGEEREAEGEEESVLGTERSETRMKNN
jgi:hypothetical protein